MAKLLGAEDPRLTPTYCPGTNGYMSPEALAEPPSYTTKLDIFSCGVLFVQLITRKFPNPGPRTYTVEVKNDPRFPKGRILVEVPELERRKDHLDLVPPTHPLLEVALDCLKDEEGPRPTAEQLCSRLIALKEGCAYQDSLQQTPGEPPPPARDSESEERVEDLTRQVQQLQLQKDELVQELQVSRHDNEQVVAALQQSVEQKDEALRAKDVVLREKNKLLQEKERQIRDLQQSVGRSEMVSTGPLRLEWREGPRTPVATFGASVAVSGGRVYCYDGISSNKVLMYNSESEEWTVLPECPNRYFSIAVVNGVLTAIGGRHKGTCTATKTLLSLPHSQQDISQQKWIEQFSPMNYCHNNPAATTTNTSLIVAGGWGPDKAKAPVEVMDTQTLQWSTVARLPHPLSQATATICGSRLYIGGGYTGTGGSNDGWIKSVLMCELSDLLQPQSPAARLRLSHTSGVWREVAELPVVVSSLVTFQGQLLAVGGGVTARDADTTSEVRQYDAATNSWTVISQMRVRRSACFTAVLPSNRLMVCGGLTPHRRTDRVEMAAVV